MKGAVFLRDRLALLLSTLGAAAFAGLLLYLLGVELYPVCFILALFLLSVWSSLLVEFLRKRAYYRQVEEALHQLEKKFLLSQVIPPASFYEGRYLYEVLAATEKSMNDHVDAYRHASREYKEFIESWVHEIKTPIAASHLLCENHPGALSSAFAVQLAEIQEYVDQALFYARSSYVEKDYLIREVPLSEIVHPALRRLSRGLIERKARIHTEGLDTRVMADPKWMEFVVLQLVKNAMQYSQGPPEITFTGRPGADSVTLTVGDHGLGIPSQDLPRIFEKGFTGVNGRRSAHATGMGLYLARKLCSRMGIALSVVSILGKGTEMTVHFPMSSMHRLLERDIQEPAR